MNNAEKSPLFVTSLAKGLALLTSFGSQQPSMNLVEMAKATGLNKSTIQRSAFTLEALGYIAKQPNSKQYRLTTKSLEVGSGYLQTGELIELANPYLNELNRSTQESCNLLEPLGTDMVYVSRFAGHQQISVHIPLGQKLPMYCTSAGRAYLSALPLEEANRLILASNRVAHTAKTVTDTTQLINIIQQARNDGYGYTDEEYYVGDIAVAASIINAEGKPLGAINISVPFSRWSLAEVRESLAPQVINAARSISSAARKLRPLL